MNTRKMTALTTVMLGLAMVVIVTASCHKSSSSTPQTLYDSLGGTTMVADPANSGTQIEKGYLGIPSAVQLDHLAGQSAIYS